MSATPLTLERSVMQMEDLSPLSVGDSSLVILSAATVYNQGEMAALSQAHRFW